MRFECHNIGLIFIIPYKAYIDKVQQGAGQLECILSCIRLC